MTLLLIAVPVTAIFAVLVGYTAGASYELHRVLDYLDTHLDRDPDWIRAGIAADEHHQTKEPRR